MLMAKTEFSNVFSYNSKPSLRFAKITQGIKCVLGPLGTQFLIPSLWPQKWLSALNISGIFSILQWREDNHITNSSCSYHQLSSVQWLSRVHLFATPWTAAHQASLPITNSEFTQTHVHWVSDAIQPSHPIRPLFLLPSIFPSISNFSSDLPLRIRWPKYWSFSFSISPSNEYSGLISFRIDWLDLLAVQGTLKSLLQHYSSKASILQLSAFFVAPSHICTWLLEKP